MPYKIAKRDGRYRLTDPKTGRIARNPSGSIVDGGGHETRQKAARQAAAIISSEARKR